ncbi:hypothetical protein HMPREF1624_07097 [Sporothrix schenckii ATCC 58251]|uniref:Uncharacterized protein n=1 Tax=Sporothrix schenckii (strain ATCC 58251 / de Perez 2211183) TaxID=1391915 RepID=U7PN64_SPOS1|nr:hypothetical protein HMPREF1624_07097 [Sporothrix schenckii ATCC 58251]
MPSFFVPARSSRHRTACFALYKALVKRARLVPLPDHVAYRTPDKPYVHPIHRFVRHSFQQNRADTSPRLVFVALNAGYKFIQLLDAARTPESPAHKSIVSYLERRAPPTRPPKALRGKLERLEKERAKKERKAAREAGLDTTGDTDEFGRPRHPPVIVRRLVPNTEKVSHDGIRTQLYEYVPGAPSRPLSDIPGGVRPVPKFVTEATGIPFLRFGKPQPPILSRAIRLKGKKRRRRAQIASALIRDEMPFAGQEDTWEANLIRATMEEAAARKAAGEPKSEAAATFLQDVAEEPTYRSSIAVSIAYLNAQLNVETADMLARARGLLGIVDRERALAEKEEKQRQAEKQAGQTTE